LFFKEECHFFRPSFPYKYKIVPVASAANVVLDLELEITLEGFWIRQDEL
jgi:hypothetical protein